MSEVQAELLQTKAASPFLPGTNIQYAWDSTSLGYLKQCPRLYQYIMIDGWADKDESIHLRFGIEFHAACQDYDVYLADGVSREDAIRTVVKDLLTRTWGWEVDEDTRAGKYKNRRSLLRLVIDYLDHYRDDAAETVILKDGSPAVELSFRFELDWGPDSGPRTIGDSVEQIHAQPYVLAGHLDKVVDLDDSLFVADKKTTTMTPGSYYFDQFQPNNQMTLYTLAGQIVLGSPVKGVIVDAAQILINSTAFQRGMTYRTQDQLDEWLADLRHWFAQAERYAKANYWPMNDTACDKYGGCRFREICSKSPQVREKFLASHFTKLAPEERWNPLKPR